MNSAPITGISRMRMATDGTGVRTLVAFYGCPLRCKYCLNPQTISPDTVPKVCSSSELYEQLRIDDLYFQATNGGVTFGGGEPLLYPEFIREVMEYSPFWSYWIETSLNVPYQNVNCIANSIDKFVIDLKSIDDSIYRQYTGKDNSQVKSNFVKLVELVGTERVIARVPQIKGYTTSDSINETIKWIKSFGNIAIDCFTYRTKSQTPG